MSTETAQIFRSNLEKNRTIQRTALFINLANNPTIKRILMPRLALTKTEY